MTCHWVRSHPRPLLLPGVCLSALSLVQQAGAVGSWGLSLWPGLWALSQKTGNLGVGRASLPTWVVSLIVALGPGDVCGDCMSWEPS